MPYIPRQSDIDWTVAHLNKVSHNAVWTIPMNNTVWRVDKVNRVLKLAAGQDDRFFEVLTAVCAKIGYRVIRAPETPALLSLGSDDHGSGKTKTK